MTFHDFTDMVRDHVSRRFGPDYTVSVQTIEKNNGVQFEGIMILHPGKNLSPLIYVNPYYHQYLNGLGMEEICEDISRIYEEKLKVSNLNISFFFDYEKVRRLLIPKLIHYEKNLALLADTPHIRILDLAVVFLCLLDSPNTENGYATILIRDHHMQYWHTTSQDLYKNALKNAPQLLPYSINSLRELLEEFELSSPESDADDAESLMYVLSNSCRINGAAVILYDHLLADLADRFESDLIVLPSSIHEVILVPATKDEFEQQSRFDEMVREVNDIHVADDEVLSDHAYYYDRKMQELKVI